MGLLGSSAKYVPADLGWINRGEYESIRSRLTSRGKLASQAAASSFMGMVALVLSSIDECRRSGNFETV
jgi:hypothetical protein